MSRPRLPSIVPDGRVNVIGERHTYTVFETSAGPEAQKTYDLNKAPVESILRVTGTSGGDSTIFVAEADFTLSADGVDESLSSKLVDSASGRDLDEIGKLFGPIIGRRTGRSDDQYRVYLKSIVQSFISRGTIGGIKGAIAAATIVGPDDITINEFFDDNEFSVNISLDASTQLSNVITGSVIEDVADLSAPAGVRLRLVRFSPQDAQEDISIDDDTTVRDAINTADEMSAVDTAAFDRRGLFEAVASADAFSIDPNQTTTSDTLFSADAFAIDPNQTTTADTLFIADQILTDANQTSVSDDVIVDETVGVGGFNQRDSTDDTTVSDTSLVDDVGIHEQRWEQNDTPSDRRWSFFSWTTLNQRSRTSTDAVGVTDGQQIDANVVSAASDIVVDDTPVVESQDIGGANKTIVAAAASIDDVVSIDSTSTAETVTTDDSPASTETIVAWSLGAWNTIEWTKDH